MTTFLDLGNGEGNLGGGNAHLTITNGSHSFSVAGFLTEEVFPAGADAVQDRQKFYPSGWIEFIYFPTDLINQGPTELTKFEPRIRNYLVQLLAGPNPLPQQVEEIYQKYPDLRPVKA